MVVPSPVLLWYCCLSGLMLSMASREKVKRSCLWMAIGPDLARAWPVDFTSHSPSQPIILGFGFLGVIWQSGHDEL